MESRSTDKFDPLILKELQKSNEVKSLLAKEAQKQSDIEQKI